MGIKQRLDKHEYRRIRISFRQKDDVHTFFNALRREKIRVRSVVFDESTVECQIRWHDLEKVRQIRRKFRLPIRLLYEQQNPVLQLNLRTVFGMLLLLVIPFLFQFYTWGYDVQSATIERQVEVEKLLKNINIPIRTTELPDEHELRQFLLEQLDDVAWVHIEKSGARLKINVEEAPVVESETIQNGQFLVANQAGVVTHYLIESGVKQFTLNEAIEKGKILVTGEVLVGEDVRQVPVRGKVFVDFWRTVNFSMPKTVQYSTQENVRWMIGQPAKQEIVMQELLPWKWVPSWLNIRKVSTIRKNVVTLNEKNIDNIILPLIQEKMLATLSEDASIRSEKLLHVTFDNDTVKGQVLYLVNENVAVLSSSD